MSDADGNNEIIDSPFGEMYSNDGSAPVARQRPVRRVVDGSDSGRPPRRKKKKPRKDSKPASKGAGGPGAQQTQPGAVPTQARQGAAPKQKKQGGPSKKGPRPHPQGAPAPQGKGGMPGNASRPRPKGAPAKAMRPPSGKMPPRKGAPAGAPSGPAPKRKKRHTARNVVIAVVVVFALFFGIDGIANSGKIHTGVTVGGLDVGGMTVEEASSFISSSFNPLVSQGRITMYADEEAASSTEQPTHITFDYDVLEQFHANPPQGKVFTVDPSTLGAKVDGQALAESAYSIGRGGDFFFGRLRAATIGTPVDVKVEVDHKSVESLEGLLTDFLGQRMVNPDIVFQDGAFTVVPGTDGYMVTSPDFEERLVSVLLDTDRSFVIPMGDVRMEVGEDAARGAIDQVETAIAEPITLVYGDATWELGRDFLGQAISTYVTPGAFGNSLTPYVSIEKISTLIPSLEGIDVVGTPAQNARFAYDGANLSSTPPSNGLGPDYEQIAGRMNLILFGDANRAREAGEVSEENAAQEAPAAEEGDPGNRRVVMELVESYPTMTLEDAEALGFTSNMIVSYSIDIEDSSDNKLTNIKLLSDILTNTVVQPGEVFSINDTAGECNEEKGFREAGSILDGGVTSEIGGGICAVATTIFNATFDGGFEIVERHNHSNYMYSYPDGRDAAISWPYMDFSFRNDTDNPILLLVNYTDTQLICSIWGVSPGWRVESELVEWTEGEEYPTVRENDPDYPEGSEYVKSYGQDGHTTVVDRKVYDQADALVKDESFVSVYQPKKQIIAVGTSDGSSSYDEEDYYDDSE